MILFLMLACTVGCDQTSKHLARVNLTGRSSMLLPGRFGELQLAENSGSFLSLGDTLSVPLRFSIFTGAVGVGLLGLFVYLVRNRRFEFFTFIGLTLVWAGGVSNLIDRITRGGAVTDFIVLRAGHIHTGVFNAADVIILLGFAILLYGLFKQRSAPPQSPASHP